MSSTDDYGSCAAVLYCEWLLGLRGDCNIPYCRQRESSTGWLLYDVATASWLIGFRCPDHGCGGAWRPEWQPLIDRVIEVKAKEGFDLSAAVEASRGGRAGKGRWRPWGL